VICLDCLKKFLGTAATICATLAAAYDFVDTGETNEDVDDSLNLHPLTNEHVYNVPVGTADEPT
jgi:hypothetical protein